MGDNKHMLTELRHICEESSLLSLWSKEESELLKRMKKERPQNYKVRPRNL